MDMNHIKFIDLFMLKLCNLNGWKIVMQLNVHLDKYFFECIYYMICKIVHPTIQVYFHGMS